MLFLCNVIQSVVQPGDIWLATLCYKPQYTAENMRQKHEVPKEAYRIILNKSLVGTRWSSCGVEHHDRLLAAFVLDQNSRSSNKSIKPSNRTTHGVLARHVSYSLQRQRRQPERTKLLAPIHWGSPNECNEIANLPSC
jgi:hypothetical protein